MDKETLADLGNDFYNFLAAGDLENANKIVEVLAENGMYEDALIFVRAICKARMLTTISV